jgi:hypothetical protein
MYFCVRLMPVTKAVDQGIDACCQGVLRSACPYAPGTREHRDWLRGWDEVEAALPKCEGWRVSWTGKQGGRSGCSGSVQPNAASSLPTVYGFGKLVEPLDLDKRLSKKIAPSSSG